jgi:hypothetical protein
MLAGCEITRVRGTLIAITHAHPLHENKRDVGVFLVEEHERDTPEIRENA